jgi:hypothetical protein
MRWLILFPSSLIGGAAPRVTVGLLGGMLKCVISPYCGVSAIESELDRLGGVL